MCQHKLLKEYTNGGVCPTCERACVSCSDCERWLLQDTADLYDGFRCSRCFDKFLLENKKGMFGKGKVDVNVYGCYRNEIEWDSSRRCYDKTPAFTVQDFKDDSQDSYVYDDFCVPDDVVDAEDAEEEDVYARNQQIMDEKYNQDDSEAEDSTFEVEKIVDYDHDNRLWLVKWKNYSFEAATWEPYEHLKSNTVFHKYMIRAH